MTELSDSTKERAALELNETEERRSDALRDLRAAMKSLPEESLVSEDDNVLLMFLRTSKFNVSRAVEMMKTYSHFRRKHLDLFADLTLESVASILRNGVFRLLKEKDDEGRRVVVFRISSWNVSEASIDDIQRAGAFLLDILIREPESQIHGLVVIDDLEGCTWTHMWQFSVRKIERAMGMFKGAFPARYKGYHFIKEPWYYNMFFKIARSFLSAKMASRLHFHGSDLESLHKHLPTRVLPARYGGTGEEISAIELLSWLSNHSRTYDKPDKQ